MEEIKTNTTEYPLGNLKMTVTSDVIEGEELDTKIEIEGNVLCWIAGCDKQDFVDKIRELVHKHCI